MARGQANCKSLVYMNYAGMFDLSTEHKERIMEDCKNPFFKLKKKKNLGGGMEQRFSTKVYSLFPSFSFSLVPLG